MRERVSAGTVRGALALVALVACAAQASIAAQGNAPAAPSCAGVEHRQFDFWVGHWTVKGPAGKVAGTNEIAPILGGCALKESWTGAGGMSGTSLNAYDASDGHWHQTWVDDKGMVLKISGGLHEGRMVMSGETAQNGSTTRILHRITWEKVDDDHLRQVWETSTDKGATWSVAFDGRYERARS